MGSQEETISIIDKYIQQLVNSEFQWKSIREIVVSALVGHVRREKRRKRNNKPKYRSGKESLSSRIEKKLTEKYNWFRKKKKEDEDIEEKNRKKDKERKKGE